MKLQRLFAGGGSEMAERKWIGEIRKMNSGILSAFDTLESLKRKLHKIKAFEELPSVCPVLAKWLGSACSHVFAMMQDIVQIALCLALSGALACRPSESEAKFAGIQNQTKLNSNQLKPFAGWKTRKVRLHSTLFRLESRDFSLLKQC